MSIILHPSDKRMFSFFLPWVGFKDGLMNVRKHFMYFKNLSSMSALLAPNPHSLISCLYLE